jgi:anti-sigma B factor antagonist
LKITVTEQVSRTVIVAPQERLDAFSAPQMRERLEALLAEGATQFVIDLSQTPFLDSAGMAVLVSLLKRARQAGGDVQLVKPTSDAVLRILQLTRFDRVFDMLDALPAK